MNGLSNHQTNGENKMPQTMPEQEYLRCSALIQKLIETLNNQIHEIVQPYLKSNIKLHNEFIKTTLQNLEEEKQRLIDCLNELQKIKLI